MEAGRVHQLTGSDVIPNVLLVLLVCQRRSPRRKGLSSTVFPLRGVQKIQLWVTGGRLSPPAPKVYFFALRPRGPSYCTHSLVQSLFPPCPPSLGLFSNYFIPLFPLKLDCPRDRSEIYCPRGNAVSGEGGGGQCAVVLFLAEQLLPSLPCNS